MIIQDNIIDIALKNPNIKTFMFDKSGTILSYTHILEQADQALAELVDMGKEVIIITNSSCTSRTNKLLLKEYAHMFKGIHYHQIFSTGDVIREEFSKQVYADKKFLVLGELADENIFPNRDQFIIANNDRDFINIYKRENISYFFIGFPIKNGERFSRVEDFTSLSRFIAKTKKPVFACYSSSDNAIDQDGNYYILQKDILARIKSEQEKLFGHKISRLIKMFGKIRPYQFSQLLYENVPEFNPKLTIMIGDHPDMDIAFGKTIHTKTAYVITNKRNTLPDADHYLKSISGSRYGVVETNVIKDKHQQYFAKQRTY